MPEESITLTSTRPEQEVMKTLEDALTVIGQCSITKKGGINKSKEQLHIVFEQSRANGRDDSSKARRPIRSYIKLQHETYRGLLVSVLNWFWAYRNACRPRGTILYSKKEVGGRYKEGV